MKKTLLIGTALCIGVTGFAQNSRLKVGPSNPKKLITSTAKTDAERAFPVAGTKRTKGPQSVNSSSCVGMHISSGPNAFGVGGGITNYKQQSLTYNKDLNVINYAHRRSADWNLAQNNSGVIQDTWYNLTTLTWDSTITYLDSTGTNAGRYPQGMLYAPAGVTGTNGTWVVSTGPVLPAGNTTWSGSYYTTRKLTGTAADQVEPLSAQTSGPNQNVHLWPGAPFGNGHFINQDICQAGNNPKIFAGGGLVDPALSAMTGYTKGAVVIHADFSNGSPVWKVDSMIPGLFTGPNNGYASDDEGARVAFDPTGTIGYAVLLGRLATNYNNSADSALVPLVYKSTDGGTTWAFKTAVSQGYDWNTGHPELTKNTSELITGAKNFELAFDNGVDLAVDAYGMLHLAGTMVIPYLDGAKSDSLQYTYSFNYDYKTHHPIVWDLITDGSCWKTIMIDSLQSSVMGGQTTDSTSLVNPWSDGTGAYLGYGARLQVSRSLDGTKIFFGWMESDASVLQNSYNTAPDIWMKGLDVGTWKMTARTNVTNGINTCYFMNLSDIAYKDANNKWITPAAYTIGRVINSGVYDGSQAADHYLVTCGGFAAGDFTIQGTVNNDQFITACAVGIKTNSTFAAGVSAYPNPFTRTTNINVTLDENKAINVNVFDAIGNMVYTKTVNGNMGDNSISFDAANLNAGVYYYTVTAGYEKVTKKLVLQK
jgi:hypothetical protein